MDVHHSDGFFNFLFGLFTEPHVEENEPKKEDIGSIFKSATKLLKDWSKKIGKKDWSSIGSEEVNKVLDKMKKLSKNIMPENAAEQVKMWPCNTS